MPAANLRAVVATFLFLAFSGHTSVRAAELTADQWREDLQVLDRAVRTDHKSPFHTVSEGDYAAMVESLHRQIPTLSDQEIIVEMAAIVAAINDGHTRLTGWQRNADRGFHSWPVALYWFSDGLYVRQAHRDLAELVGARVLRIGDYSAEDAQAMIERVVAADNSYGERFGGPFYLISPEVLQAVGITEDIDDPPYVLEKDGRTWSPEIRPLDDSWPGWTLGFIPADAGWVDARDGSTAPVPLWLRKLDRTFWFEYLAGENTLYVQQNQILHAADERLEAFYARVWNAFESNGAEKLVLDLRLNGGGNNYLNKPALTMMVRADASAQTYTVIGRQTFSACQNLVNELSRWTDTIFVGEPTGERVNFYGDTRSTELPNSGLTVRASWLWWQNLDPRDTRDALYPDLAVDLSFADYAGNQDRAMEVIRSSRRIFRAEELITLIDDEGMDAARATLLESVRDPLFRHRNMESEINDLGYLLLGEHRVDDAIAVFQLNVDEFPDSWNTYDSLGEAWENRGEPETALEQFRKSVAINPDSPSGLAAIERLESQVTGSSAPRE